MATAVGPPSAIAASRTDDRRPVRLGPLTLAWPAALGMLVLCAAPFVTFLVYSVLTAGLFSASGPLTLENYRSVLETGANGILAKNSAEIGFYAASASLALGLPVAYWLRYAAGRAQMPVFFLIMSTLFASYLVRIYGWRSILGENGLINAGLNQLGITDKPLGFLLYNKFSVTVALVHIFLPYVVMVLYAGFGPLSPALIESAQDLGANAFTRWRRVILPLVAAPAASVFMFVFILAAGDYVTPQLVGGSNAVLLGVQIQSAFKSDGNFALGAATAVLMLVGFAVLYAIVTAALRLTKLDRIRWSS